jgi:voltage-gated potassium channel
MLKQKISFYLDDITTQNGRSINIAIAFLVIASAVSFVAQTFDISNDVRLSLNSLDNTILGTFVLEYLLRLWCAEEKLKYCFSLYAIIDLLAILPFLLGAVNLPFLRLLRWFRILRLIRLIESRSLFDHKTEDIAILFRILFTLFAIVFIFSGLIYQVEHPINPKFDNFLDAFYYSIFTMTTVGYSGVTPQSEAGKLVTVLMVLTGIALIPVQLGELFKRLVVTANQSDRDDPTNQTSNNQTSVICSGCGLSTHDSDAKFCKVCGTKL